MTEVPLGPVVDQVASARAAGIRTFVLGSPGSLGVRSELSRMAVEGGTALPGCSDAGPSFCHFDLTTATDMEAAMSVVLAEIVARTNGCSFEVSEPLNDLSRVSVHAVSATTVGVTDRSVDRESACGDGWYYSEDRREILLCGRACTDFKYAGNTHIEIRLDCATDTP